MSENLFKSKSYFFIAFGVLIGLCATFSLPILLVLCLSVYVVFVFRKNATTLEEKEFITYVCVLAIGIRVLISLFILGYGMYFGTGSDIFGDAMGYEGVGVYIKEAVTGIPIKRDLWGDNLIAVSWLREIWPEINLKSEYYTVPGVSYWYGYLNTLWGLSFLAPKILNGLMWTIGSFWIYLFFRDRYFESGTKFGLLIILFLPSSLIFSSSGLKDSLLFLLITSIIYSSHMLERSNHRCYATSALLISFLLNMLNLLVIENISFFLISVFILSIMMVTWNNKYWLFWGLLIICSGLLLPKVRSYVYYFVLIFSFFILINKLDFKRIIVYIFLITILTSSIFQETLYRNLFLHFKVASKHIISSSILTNYNTARGNTAYHIYPEKYYANIETRDTVTYPEVFIAYLSGLRYVFFEPNPWSFRTPRVIIMFPETCFVWFFMPFIILGTIIILRKNKKITLSIILFLFLTTSLLALGQGNMGTLVRTRWTVMPWYFMIGAIGLNAKFHRNGDSPRETDQKEV